MKEAILTIHLLGDVFDYFSVPLRGRGVKWGLLLVHVFVLEIFQKSNETLLVVSSHGIVVEDSCKSTSS